jgi:hypothetical protein
VQLVAEIVYATTKKEYQNQSVMRRLIWFILRECRERAVARLVVLSAEPAGFVNPDGKLCVRALYICVAPHNLAIDASNALPTRCIRTCTLHDLIAVYAHRLLQVELVDAPLLSGCDRDQFFDRVPSAY